MLPARRYVNSHLVLAPSQRGHIAARQREGLGARRCMERTTGPAHGKGVAPPPLTPRCTPPRSEAPRRTPSLAPSSAMESRWQRLSALQRSHRATVHARSDGGAACAAGRTAPMWRASACRWRRATPRSSRASTASGPPSRCAGAPPPPRTVPRSESQASQESIPSPLGDVRARLAVRRGARQRVLWLHGPAGPRRPPDYVCARDRLRHRREPPLPGDPTVLGK